MHQMVNAARLRLKIPTVVYRKRIQEMQKIYGTMRRALGQVSVRVAAAPLGIMLQVRLRHVSMAAGQFVYARIIQIRLTVGLLMRAKQSSS